MHDFENQRYINSKGEEIPLTPLENITLAVLLEKRGSIVTKKQLILDLYNQRSDECLEMCIRGLIKKLRVKLNGEVEIRTRRGLGYYIFNS